MEVPINRLGQILSSDNPNWQSETKALIEKYGENVLNIGKLKNRIFEEVASKADSYTLEKVAERLELLQKESPTTQKAQSVAQPILAPKEGHLKALVTQHAAEKGKAFIAAKQGEIAQSLKSLTPQRRELRLKSLANALDNLVIEAGARTLVELKGQKPPYDAAFKALISKTFDQKLSEVIEETHKPPTTN